MAASGESVDKSVVKSTDIRIKGTGKRKGNGIYMENVLTRKVTLNFNDVGKNVQEILEKKLKMNMENKCVNEGYIKPNSIRVQTYSSGMLESCNVVFQTSFKCLICNPVEGQNINVIAKNITKAGIRAVYGSDNNNSPIDVFIARDHSYDSDLFNSIEEGNKIKVRVIGTRYELNDSSISVLATVIKSYKGEVGKKSD